MKVDTKTAEQPINATLTYNSTTGEPNGHYLGLTKREYFAGLAMQGMLSHKPPAYDGSYYGVGARNTEKYREDFCKTAISIADELLKQLENN